MGRSLAVQLSIWKFQILFIYFHRNFYTSNTWDCTKWQFILTTHCLGKHLSNEECWNQSKLLYLSLSIADFLATGPNFSYFFSTVEEEKQHSDNCQFCCMKSWLALYVSNNNNIAILSKNTQSNCWGLFTGSHHTGAESRPASLWNDCSKSLWKLMYFGYWKIW